MRHSDVAYVLIHLRAGGRNCVMLHRHPKWGDWSLVGGHVEPGEEDDWLATAAREAGEELAPLTLGTDFDVERLDVELQWGPCESRSAGGMLTEYRAQYFVLRFSKDPRALLPALQESEFRLLPIEAIEADGRVGHPLRLFMERVKIADDVPLSWAQDLGLEWSPVSG